MFEPVVDTTLTLLSTVGLPILFGVFVLKGAIVGKPLPTSVLLPGYVLATSTAPSNVAVAVLVASVGYVCGQLLIYFGARRGGAAFVRSLPWTSDGRLRRAERLFGTYSGAGVFVTNLVPYLGSFVLVPAGLASYPVGRLLVYALSSTLINYAGIVLLALGVIELLF